MIAQKAQRQSTRHLRSSNRERIFIQLLLLEMFDKEIAQATLSDMGSAVTRITVPSSDLTSGESDWMPAILCFNRIRRRLTLMTGVSQPVWLRATRRLRLPPSLTEILETWFWHPRLQAQGEF